MAPFSWALSQPRVKNRHKPEKLDWSWWPQVGLEMVCISGGSILAWIFPPAKKHILTLELSIQTSCVSMAYVFMLPLYTESAAPVLSSSPQTLLRHSPCTDSHVHISFLEGPGILSWNLHIHTSFTDMQEAEASIVCIHKYDQAHIVLWAQSLMYLFLHMHKVTKIWLLLWTLLHTHIKMRFSAHVYAQVPKCNWQMSEMRSILLDFTDWCIFLSLFPPYIGLSLCGGLGVTDPPSHFGNHQD